MRFFVHFPILLCGYFCRSVVWSESSREAQGLSKLFRFSFFCPFDLSQKETSLFFLWKWKRMEAEDFREGGLLLQRWNAVWVFAELQVCKIKRSHRLLAVHLHINDILELSQNDKSPRSPLEIIIISVEVTLETQIARWIHSVSGNPVTSYFTQKTKSHVHSQNMSFRITVFIHCLVYIGTAVQSV